MTKSNKGKWIIKKKIAIYINDEYLDYKDYSLSVIYRNYYEDLTNTSTSNENKFNIPTKLINLLIHSRTKFSDLKKILYEVEYRELNFGEIIINLQSISETFGNTLKERILTINKIFYGILLSKLFNLVDNSFSIKNLNWYLSKADFNGLSLPCLINDLKNYMKDNENILGKAKIDYYLRSLNFHSKNIYIEFKYNGNSEPLIKKNDYFYQNKCFDIPKNHIDELLGDLNPHINDY